MQNKYCLSDGAYELAVSYLSSTGEKARSVYDERLLCQKIKSRLGSISTGDADKFHECYAKLKNSVSNLNLPISKGGSD